jgi:hypothetical protein
VRHTAITAAGLPLEAFSFAVAAFCLAIWAAMLAGRAIVRLSARGVCAITGYLSAPPDPWLEYTLRGALAEFDRELRKVVPRLYGHPRREESR